ncbi:MAG: beta-lactamase family protein, partial [Clostridia bacterium]|nr:beta-lactamase family protein [Clostridia bacterium]
MFEKTLEFINSGVGTAYPCAAVAIGLKDKVFAREFFEVDEETLFDLASLSKLVSTTAIALKFIENGKLSLDDNIGKFLDYTGNYADCKIKHLLTHTSGIPAWLPLFNMRIDKENSLKTILDSDKCSKTGERVAYSCMGYIVLGKILEIIGGDSLDNLAKKFVFSPLKMVSACYNPNNFHLFAATEWGKGKVHDENAAFLGGIAGNAGVFATLDDVICFAKMCSTNG